MDLWGFKKWRRKLGYTQVEAGESSGSVAAPFSIGKARSGRYHLPSSLPVKNCSVCGSSGRSLAL
jgi:hypothetical protein